MRGLAALVLAPLATLAFVHVATTMMPGPRTVEPRHPQAVVWAGRVFTSKPEFVTWLERRDHGYAHWVKTHPGASPWEPVAATATRAPAPEPASSDGGLDLNRTLLAMLLALLAVGAVLAVRAGKTILPAARDLVVQQRGAAFLRAPASRVVALAGPRAPPSRSNGRPTNVRRVADRPLGRVQAAIAASRAPVAEALPPMTVKAPSRVVEEQELEPAASEPQPESVAAPTESVAPVPAPPAPAPAAAPPPVEPATVEAVSRHVPTCSNCGGQVPADARFCPNCAAPVRTDLATSEGPAELRTQRPRWERRLFAAAVVVLVAIVVLAVLVIVFGVLVEPSGPYES